MKARISSAAGAQPAARWHSQWGGAHSAKLVPSAGMPKVFQQTTEYDAKLCGVAP